MLGGNKAALGGCQAECGEHKENSIEPKSTLVEVGPTLVNVSQFIKFARARVSDKRSREVKGCVVRRWCGPCRMEPAPAPPPDVAWARASSYLRLQVKASRKIGMPAVSSLLPMLIAPSTPTWTATGWTWAEMRFARNSERPDPIRCWSESPGLLGCLRVRTKGA